jgi:pimeloyl-ACP methyl ester carboxylesterase
VTGCGEPTLIFIHGWALDRRIWDDEAKRLSPRYRVVTLDLDGHGESAGMSITPARADRSTR